MQNKVEKNNIDKETIRDYKPNIYISWLQDMLKIIDQYGFLKIIKALLIFFVSSYFIYLTFNPEIIIDKYIKYQTEQHDNAVAYRMKNEPQIRMNLKELLMETSADRAFIIELHNGTNNTSGLPFIYGDMSYEEVRKGVTHIDEDYHDFSLQRFTFFSQLFNDGSWYGSVDQMESFDPKLALRLKSNGVHEIGVVVMYGHEKEIGFIGISFTGNEDAHDKNQMKKVIRKYCQKISPLLDAMYLQ